MKATAIFKCDNGTYGLKIDGTDEPFYCNNMTLSEVATLLKELS